MAPSQPAKCHSVSLLQQEEQMLSLLRCCSV
jgi:hypothetical protein